MKSFKQKAIYAAVSGASLLLAANAAAVNVNQDGLGEILIYPYYTVRNGNNTLVSVVNTTTQAKAVKVRFIEGKNSAEVLDFNLFLSAYDVWTGAVVATPAGAGLISADLSCTNPAVNTGTVIPFRNVAYSGDRPELQTLDRTREGYVEMIEMAAIRPGSPTEAAVTHKATGKPDCVGTNLLAGTTFEVISNNALLSGQFQADYLRPTGGLFGNGTIVGNSMANGYNAVALQGIDGTGNPTASNNQVPSISTGLNTTAVVVDTTAGGTTRVVTANFATARDAVSAVLMHSAVLGEYAYSSDAAGNPVFSTDWVVTMPTKRQYVNRGGSVLAPFSTAWNGARRSTVTNAFNGDGSACDTVTLESFDREEGRSASVDDFSPSREEGNALCYEANVISFGGLVGTPANAFVTAPSRSLGSTNATGYNAYQRAGKEGGWASLTFTSGSASLSAPTGSIAFFPSNATAPTISNQPVTFSGLPVIGFAVSDYRASAANGNYNSGYSLNFRRDIR